MVYFRVTLLCLLLASCSQKDLTEAASNVLSQEVQRAVYDPHYWGRLKDSIQK